ILLVGSTVVNRGRGAPLRAAAGGALAPSGLSVAAERVGKGSAAAPHGAAMPFKYARARSAKVRSAGPRTFLPVHQPIVRQPSIHVREAARHQVPLAPVPEIREADAPGATPGPRPGVPIAPVPAAPTPSTTGPSPGPSKTFQGEFLSGTSIPPDTMGAVG